jgi:hypothetical protein
MEISNGEENEESGPENKNALASSQIQGASKKKKDQLN